MRISGLHAVEEALKRGGVRGNLLISGRGKRIEAVIRLAETKGISVSFVSRRELDAHYGSVRHHGIVFDLDQEIQAKDTLESVLNYPRKNRLVLILDSITDPQNLGSIMRSADQFAVDIVVVPRHGSAKESATVRTISQGASAWVPLERAINLGYTIDILKEQGFWIFGAHLEGDRVDATDLKGDLGLVLGSEGRGIRSLIKKRCDGLIRIPSWGHLDSFNVSMAAAILMYEIRRQQNFMPEG